ncbi:hypothetical protein SESBI_10332 [Sesbania bispinosa]|nr:hypothetical protein SESBI_10332 [Sesbania bispinosa]
MEDSELMAIPTKNIEHEDITIQLDSNELEGLQLVRRTLIGKVLSDKVLNRGTVKRILLKEWASPSEIHVTDMGVNSFLFTFAHNEEAIELLQKDPWYIIGSLVSLQCWVPQASLYELNFDKTSFCVQVGIPRDMFSTSNAAKIVNKMGGLEVENPQGERKSLRTFIRVRALINVTKPLPAGSWRNCITTKAMESFNPYTPKYGSRHGAPPAKSTATLMKEQGLWNKASQASLGDNQQSNRKEEEDQRVETQQGNKSARQSRHHHQRQQKKSDCTRVQQTEDISLEAPLPEMKVEIGKQKVNGAGLGTWISSTSRGGQIEEDLEALERRNMFSRLENSQIALNGHTL